MTIATETEKLQTNLQNSYTAVQNKGGTLPQDQCFDNLPTAINTISTGGTINSLNVTPSTTAQTITASGGVDGYNPVNVSAVTASIDANIQPENIKKDVVILGTTGTFEGGGGLRNYVTYTNNGLSFLTNESYVLDGNATVIDVDSALSNAYKTNTTVTGVSLNAVKTISGSSALGYAFQGCTGLTSLDLSNLTTISGSYALSNAFLGCSGLTSADLSSLTTVSGSSALNAAFRACTGMTSVDFSSLTTISISEALYNAFRDCISLTSVDLSNLTTVSGGFALGYAFQNCRALTSVDLSSLTTLDGSSALTYTFYNCTGLTSVDLSNLTTVSGNGALSGAFYGCTGLNNESISFPALTSTSFGSKTNQFNSMLSGVTGCTVHFPSNLQSVIGSWSSVTAGFGGTNTTVLFDLPATT